MKGQQEVFVRLRRTISVVGVLVLVGACGGPLVGEVADASYQALVPTAEQFATASAKDLPGGFALLRSSGIEGIEVVVDGDGITISTDRGDEVTRSVVERRIVQDSEGSGPFKGEKEVLILGTDPIVLGDLTITNPVIWPGSFEGSPVITLKSWSGVDRGPGVSCAADEVCLLLTSGVDPFGNYDDATNPALDENPITSIEVLEETIRYTLDSGEVVETERSTGWTTDACGLAETEAWDVPIAVGLEIADPVLVHASCPSTPGDSYLMIMDRQGIPALAPLGPESGGEWCRPESNCLLFAPTS